MCRTAFFEKCDLIRWLSPPSRSNPRAWQQRGIPGEPGRREERRGERNEKKKGW
ncbi:hypothetical protein L873DRAFT_1814097 [Choiromyces venosus 120613-1]|uniref:Uncharacterized protein n=1 Tax=Choiromyces venosus 120613-1 TaxID=1336337 RepID=A0A3N4J8H0_9PEZI|nr:hypothetical protein L873DRAFT_1814097 [Choiromyces venosus 120613-1]